MPSSVPATYAHRLESLRRRAQEVLDDLQDVEFRQWLITMELTTRKAELGASQIEELQRLAGELPLFARIIDEELKEVQQAIQLF